jgi:transcriptional regulator with XRE-family HTH domain
MALLAIRDAGVFVASLGVPRDTVARRLRIALAESDMKDQDVAREAHVSAAWLGSVKQGHLKNPPIDKLRELARVLNKQTSYFTAPLGYVPVDEVENGLLIAVNEEDRELLARIASRLAAAEPPAEEKITEDPPPEAMPLPRRRARS